MNALRPELIIGERQPRESQKAVQACNDYLRLGPGRSLAKLLDRYRAGAEAPPTRRLNTLKGWSGQFEWQIRAAAYEAGLEREKNEHVTAIMQSGLALVHERVVALKELVHRLAGQLFEIDPETGEIIDFNQDHLWLPDVKTVGFGEDAERVNIVRFNKAILEQYRLILDDLAKETGGRRQMRENLNLDLTKLSDDQLERIAAGEDPLNVILSTAGRGGT
jgi:hypothetical protein